MGDDHPAGRIDNIRAKLRLHVEGCSARPSLYAFKTLLGLEPRLFLSGYKIVANIPVDKTVVHEGQSLTISELVRYTRGFVIRGELSVEKGLFSFPQGDRTERFTRPPEFPFTAADEQGRRYRPMPGFITGSGGNFQFTSQFAGSIKKDVRNIILRLPRVEWKHFDGELDKPMKGDKNLEEWVFVIPLVGVPYTSHIL